MSKIGALVFDLQEQEDAEFEFCGQPFTAPAKTELVLTHDRLESACAAYKRMRAKPVVAELNFSN